jgi:hypothetical protein
VYRSLSPYSGRWILRYAGGGTRTPRGAASRCTARGASAFEGAVGPECGIVAGAVGPTRGAAMGAGGLVRGTVAGAGGPVRGTVAGAAAACVDSADQGGGGPSALAPAVSSRCTMAGAGAGCPPARWAANSASRCAFARAARCKRRWRRHTESMSRATLRDTPIAICVPWGSPVPMKIGMRTRLCGCVSTAQGEGVRARSRVEVRGGGEGGHGGRRGALDALSDGARRVLAGTSGAPCF